MKNRRISLQDITLRGILREIKSFLPVIVLLSCATLMLMTGLGKLTYKPEYSSRATLAISVKGYSGYTSIIVSTNMATVFSDVFESDALQRKINEAAGHDVRGKISCSLVSETNLINLTATASSPRDAYLYLQMALVNYDEISGYVFSNASLDVVQEPSIPLTPSNASPLITYRVFAAAAVAVCLAGLAVLRYAFRFTVKSVSAAANQLDGTIIGSVPAEKKRKTDKKKRSEPFALTSSLISMDFTESVRMASVQIDRHMCEGKMKVLLVSSLNEHEGKTSLATSISMALAEKGKNVILIDGDFRRPTVKRLFKKRAEGAYSLSDVIEGTVSWQDAIQTDKKSGIHILFQETAYKDPTEVMKISRIKEMLEGMVQQADLVILDSSPLSVSREAEMWMQVAQSALLIVRQDWSDVRAINDAVDLVWQNCGDFTGFILNAFDGSKYFDNH